MLFLFLKSNGFVAADVFQSDFYLGHFAELEKEKINLFHSAVCLRYNLLVPDF